MIVLFRLQREFKIKLGRSSICRCCLSL